MNKLPDLFKVDVRGNKMVWRIWTINNRVVHTHGIQGGKMRDPVAKVVKGTRKGMKNERTAEEQAVFEADSKWRKQLEKGYKPDGGDVEGMKYYEKVLNEKKLQGGTNHKMSESKRAIKNAADKYIVDTVKRDCGIVKAHKYTEQKKKIKWEDKPYIQIKYDGVRCVGSVQDGQGVITTSSGKQFMHLKHIKQALETTLVGEFVDVIVDGECYVHELTDEKGNEVCHETRFNVITGACRSVRSNPHPLERKIEYHIFDIKDPTLHQEDRFRILDKLFTRVGASSPLKKAPRYAVENEEKMMKLHDKFFHKTYEGVIIRNRFGKYVNRRSYDIQKFKLFTDEECKIVGAKQGRGTEAGTVVWVCEYSNGEKFDCRPRGTREHKRELLKEYKKYLGEELTVRYQGLTGPVEKGGVPRFPVGIAIRNYE